MKKHQKTLLVTLPLVAVMSLVGCNINPNDAVNLGMKGLKALTLSDNDVKKLSQEACAQMDAK